LAEALAGLSETIGAPVYYAMYRDGEVDIVCVADTPAAPAVEEWVDFRETAHAHAIGQCLLAQLDVEARRDHLHRHPVRPVTRYTVRDEQSLLKRLERVGRTEPVTEYQEYALGTVCGAIPLTVGSTAATVAISLPVRQADRLLPALRQLQGEVGRLMESLSLSISM
ncbi:IclR family transcriptional regulator C-terminal domain-containing protein, partial [Streptomyces sp. TRM76130]|nr:IclR family transcriptional regulator C-terminal domain-containing protein [Streptomyces sp. TRM76130]